MTLEPSADVIDNLRIALKNRKLKITVVAERLNIPYRSIQNYFAKRSDMPLNVYIRICQLARIPVEYPIHGLRFNFHIHTLEHVLYNLFGQSLPSFVFTPSGLRA